jgi:hypothetical protein
MKLARGELVRTAALLIATVCSVACQPQPTTSAPARSDPPPRTSSPSNTDPCAMQLHDLCGGLLLYYAEHQSLPATLAELAEIPGFDGPLALVCPVAKKPYQYDPDGLPGARDGSRIILQDATAAHDGVRWGIRIDDPRPGQPLVARVVALP